MASVDDIINSFTAPLVGTDVPLAMQALLDADCVCFDVDSTVVNEEGIVSSVEGWVGDCMHCRGLVYTHILLLTILLLIATANNRTYSPTIWARANKSRP